MSVLAKIPLLCEIRTLEKLQVKFIGVYVFNDLVIFFNLSPSLSPS